MSEVWPELTRNQRFEMIKAVTISWVWNIHDTREDHAKNIILQADAILKEMNNGK